MASNGAVPLVSVVIPAFNSSQWIEHTLRSVLSQSVHSLEVVVVDDTSADDTPELVRAVMKKDGRVRLLEHERNSGVAAARNDGVKAAQGRYVAFLDSDDVWPEEKLERQLEALDGRELSFGNASVIDEHGTLLRVHENPASGSAEELIRQLFIGRINMFTSTLLMSKDAFRQINGFDTDLPHREDHMLLMRAVQRFDYVFHGEPLSYHRVHSGSMRDFQEAAKMEQDYAPFFSKSLEEFPFLRAVEGKAYAKMHAAIAAIHYRKKHRRQAFSYACRAVAGDAANVRAWRLLVMSMLPVPAELVLKLRRS